MRKPTVEAMLSYSTGKRGRGWVYAVNTAMDETGATLGPLLLAVALYLKADFRTAYGWLLGSSMLALCALTAARVISRCRRVWRQEDRPPRRPGSGGRIGSTWRLGHASQRG